MSLAEKINICLLLSTRRRAKVVSYFLRSSFPPFVFALFVVHVPKMAAETAASRIVRKGNREVDRRLVRVKMTNSTIRDVGLLVANEDHVSRVEGGATAGEKSVKFIAGLKKHETKLSTDQRFRDS